MRTEDHSVESIFRVSRQHGLKTAAQTYRAWKTPTRIADHTVTDALVQDRIRRITWELNAVTGCRQMAPRASADAARCSR